MVVLEGVAVSYEQGTPCISAHVYQGSRNL